MEPADTLAVTALALAGACLLAVAVLLVWTLRLRARADAEADALREELATLRSAGDRSAAPGSAVAAVPAPTTYVITGIGHDPVREEPVPDTRVDGRLFADLVLRESVVKAAALTHGVRRALAPETRNRIRFEMRREVKRARRQRRTDLRQARRHLHAEQRRTAGEDAA